MAWLTMAQAIKLWLGMVEAGAPPCGTALAVLPCFSMAWTRGPWLGVVVTGLTWLHDVSWLCRMLWFEVPRLSAIL